MKTLEFRIEAQNEFARVNFDTKTNFKAVQSCMNARFIFQATDESYVYTSRTLIFVCVLKPF